MELSEDYLDKMLNFAIKYHNQEPKDIKKIPKNFINLENAIEHFQNALEYETHSSLQEKTKIIDDPTLYTVNLDSNEPGIVLGKNNKGDNVLVHIKSKANYEAKSKKEKDKSEEEIELQAKKAIEKLEKREEEREYTNEIKEKKEVRERKKM